MGPVFDKDKEQDVARVISMINEQATAKNTSLDLALATILITSVSLQGIFSRGAGRTEMETADDMLATAECFIVAYRRMITEKLLDGMANPTKTSERVQ